MPGTQHAPGSCPHLKRPLSFLFIQIQLSLQTCLILSSSTKLLLTNASLPAFIFLGGPGIKSLLRLAPLLLSQSIGKCWFHFNLPRFHHLTGLVKLHRDTIGLSFLSTMLTLCLSQSGSFSFSFWQYWGLKSVPNAC
jgi:hypothetical protein